MVVIQPDMTVEDGKSPLLPANGAGFCPGHAGSRTGGPAWWTSAFSPPEGITLAEDGLLPGGKTGKTSAPAAVAAHRQVPGLLTPAIRPCLQEAPSGRLHRCVAPGAAGTAAAADGPAVLACHAQAAGGDGLPAGGSPLLRGWPPFLSAAESSTRQARSEDRLSPSHSLRRTASCCCRLSSGVRMATAGQSPPASHAGVRWPGPDRRGPGSSQVARHSSWTVHLARAHPSFT